MKDIVIVGAGGFGREVLWLINEINKVEPTYKILGFIDDFVKQNHYIKPYEVLGGVDYLNTLNEVSAVIAIGYPINKRDIVQRVTNQKITYPNLVFPGVIHADDLDLGKGVVICAGATLTVNIKIADFVSIHTGVTVGHDTVINPFSTVLPGCNVAGNVNIGHSTMVGTGSRIIQGLSIGDESIIGAGAVVLQDIQDNVVAVGVPATIRKKK